MRLSSKLTSSLSAVVAATVMGMALPAIAAPAPSPDFSQWVGTTAADLGVNTTIPGGVPAAARSALTPNFGPDSGGTNVTLSIDSPRFRAVDGNQMTGAAVDDMGRPWGWGVLTDEQTLQNQTDSGYSGSVGSPIPLGTPAGKKFVDVSMASSTGSLDTVTAFLAEDGSIWTRGVNQYLGLGHSSDPHADSLTSLVPVNERPDGLGFTKVSAGVMGGLAIGTDGRLYGWGPLPLLAFDVTAWVDDPSLVPPGVAEADLGSGPVKYAEYPIVLGDPDTRFVDIEMAAQSGYAVTDSGDVLYFGARVDLCAESGDPGFWAGPLTQMSLPSGVTATRVDAGVYDEGFVLDTSGRLWAFGCSFAHGTGVGAPSSASGNPVRVRLSTPTQVPHPTGGRWVDVSSAPTHSVAVDTNGHVYTWGMNSMGELGGAIQSMVGRVSELGIQSYPADPDLSLLDARDHFTATPVRIPHVTGVETAFAAPSVGGVGLGASGHPVVWGSGMFGNGLWNTSIADMTADLMLTLHSFMFDRDCLLHDDPSDPLECLVPKYADMLTDGSDLREILAAAFVDNAEVLGRTLDPDLPPMAAEMELFFPNDGGSRPMVMPVYTLDHVEFDGISAMGLKANTDGSVTVTTPPHAPGVVDVTASFSWRSGVSTGDSTENAVIWRDGYEYLGDDDGAEPSQEPTPEPGGSPPPPSVPAEDGDPAPSVPDDPEPGLFATGGNQRFMIGLLGISGLTIGVAGISWLRSRRRSLIE